MQKSLINQNDVPVSRQLYYRGKQWLYRGRRPGSIAKTFNRMWAMVASRKVMSSGLVALEVVGRKSGRVVSFPLVMVSVEGQRYLASMLGDNTQWVRNVRAAGGKAVLRSGGREDVQLEEIPVGRRAPILKAYLQIATGARPHVPVDKDAPLSEFEKIAPSYPVFRLVSNWNKLPHGVSSMNKPSSHSTPMRKKSPFLFVALVFVLSSPFWLVGAMTGLQLLPGLPISGLAAFSPLMAASLLAYSESKATGVTELLKRSFDFKRIRAKTWYIPTILLWPGVMALEYGLLRLTGLPIPAPQFSVLTFVAMFCVAFIAALGEELGWMGYAIDPMQERSSALQAGILLGLVWAAWHLVLLVQAQRPPEYIAWQCFAYVPERVLFVWLYNNTGKSVFAVAVCHAMLNVTWQLFPINGSYYDPRLTALIVTFAAVAVTVLWGPKTLAQYRYARSNTGVHSSTVA